MAPDKQTPTAKQAATLPSDKAALSTIPKEIPCLTFHLFTKLATEIQVMIWKECLPQQDESRSFIIAEPKERPRTIGLVSITKYPPVSMVCRTARNFVVSYLPIALPSVPGHPIRIHSRTTVCLKFDESDGPPGHHILVRYLKTNSVPPFMVHVNNLECNLSLFGGRYSALLCWRRIIEACPNLSSITAFKSSATSLIARCSNTIAFARFLMVQRLTQRQSQVKPEFWLHDGSTTIKIDGVGEDGENIDTDAIAGVQLRIDNEQLEAIREAMSGDSRLLTEQQTLVEMFMDAENLYASLGLDAQHSN